MNNASRAPTFLKQAMRKGRREEADCQFNAADRTM
jgi:hypothetical protein